MSKLNEKWQGNNYVTAKGYAEHGEDITLTEKNSNYVLKHLKAISEAYTQLYEEKFGEEEASKLLKK